MNRLWCCRVRRKFIHRFLLTLVIVCVSTSLLITLRSNSVNLKVEDLERCNGTVPSAKLPTYLTTNISKERPRSSIISPHTNPSAKLPTYLRKEKPRSGIISPPKFDLNCRPSCPGASSIKLPLVFSRLVAYKMIP